MVGAGKRDKFDVATLRKIAGAALRYLKSRSIKRPAFLVRENDLNEDSAQAIAEGAITANFETDKYKSDKKNDKLIERLLLVDLFDHIAQGTDFLLVVTSDFPVRAYNLLGLFP